MGERKVLNKYFPPDFDPKKVPRMKRDPEKQICVRMMIPFSLQCNTCGEFMYRGKKFNSWKEDCIGEDYLGIRKYRFYIKCVICSQEITFKTDPEKGDYELETGASRNFESWADKQATEEEHKKAREEEEKSDNMKQLENRTLDSKIELEIMDALDEIKAVNRRHENIDTAEVLRASAARREKGSDGAAAAAGGSSAEGTYDEDEALIASIKFGGPTFRRLSEDGDSDDTGRQALVGEEKEGEEVVAAAAAGGASGRVDADHGHKGRQGAAALERSGKGGGQDAALERSTGTGASVVSKSEAVRAKATGADGSMGTKIVVKPKKKRPKAQEGRRAADKSSTLTKRKKGDSNGIGVAKDKADPGEPKKVGSGLEMVTPGASVDAPPAASIPVNSGGTPLGGLNLLGAYASSSDSDAT
ncbi:unnamed protein product [Ascophyllum nodosum]